MNSNLDYRRNIVIFIHKFFRGRQIAEQLQAQNPELVDRLRNQTFGQDNQNSSNENSKK